MSSDDAVADLLITAEMAKADEEFLDGVSLDAVLSPEAESAAAPPPPADGSSLQKLISVAETVSQFYSTQATGSSTKLPKGFIGELYEYQKKVCVWRVVGECGRGPSQMSRRNARLFSSECDGSQRCVRGSCDSYLRFTCCVAMHCCRRRVWTGLLGCTRTARLAFSPVWRRSGFPVPLSPPPFCQPTLVCNRLWVGRGIFFVACLPDEMGLGKTVQVIAFIAHSTWLFPLPCHRVCLCTCP